MVVNVTWVAPTPMLFRLYKAFSETYHHID